MNYEPCEWHYPYWSIYCSDCCTTVVVDVTAKDAQGRDVL